MQVLALLAFILVGVAAQFEEIPDVVEAEKILLPCCNKLQTYEAKCQLYAWIFGHYNCDPLFRCIFKCLGVAIVPTGCSPNTSLHISFNFWLLNNYKCLPNSLLQCLKGCIIYNSWPPCPIKDVPIEFDIKETIKIDS